MKKRILIVEDNALVREMYRSALKSTGADLIETQHGELVVDIATREMPDLVLLDLVLPDIGGREVLRRLRACSQTAKIPVLAVTNAVSAGDEGALQREGFSGLISKPIDLRHFPQIVLKYLAS